MLSICIPIYNQSISLLLNDLTSHLNDINEEVEIIFIDDASTNKELKKQNKSIRENVHRYIILEQNIGRAKIRNLFLKYVNYDYLLFIDGDSKIIIDEYLKKIINIIKSNKKHKVISFSSIYQKEKPRHKYQLRWYYGKKIESSILKSNNKSFMTNNFLIERKLFEKIHFNENITDYGHEDTLFGYDLKKHDIQIKNIFNPVLNNELDTNNIFIKKTETSIETLLKISLFLNEKKFNHSVTLLHVFEKIKKQQFLYRILSNKLMNKIFRIVTKKTVKTIPSFTPLFNIYKLLYLIYITKNQ